VKKGFLIIPLLNLVLIALGAIKVMFFMGIKQGKSDGLAYAKNIINRLVLGSLSKENESALKHLFLKSIFFQTCMDHARPSSSLCNSVLTMGDLFQLEAWMNKQCQQKGRTDR